ncbi:uncharacterized protein V6R79_017546 [Siganus canaliculatus]
MLHQCQLSSQNGGQPRIMASQHPADPRVACSRSHWKPGNPPSSHVRGVHALQASQSFQHPKHCDASKSNNQTSRKDDPYRRPAAHVSAQHSCYFVVSDKETSATHSVGHHHQQMKSSKGRDSSLNLDVLRQQSDRLDLPSCTSSAAHQGNHPGITAQSISLQNSTPFVQQRNPLLYTLLMRSSPVEKLLPWSAKETNAKVTPNTTLCNTLRQQQSSFYNLNNTSATEGGGMESFSDDSIQNFIWNEVRKQRRSGNLQSSRESAFHTPDTNPSLPLSCILPMSGSAGHLPTTSAFNEEGLAKKVFNSMNKRSSTEVGQASEEDNPLCGRMSDHVWPAVRSHSTDCPAILEKVTPTFSKAEDDSPVAVTAVSQVVSGQLTRKHPRTSLDSSQDENKAFRSDINRTLKYLKKHAGDSVQAGTGSISSNENQGEFFQGEKNVAQPCMDRCAEVMVKQNLSVSPPISDYTNRSGYQWSPTNREERVDVGSLCLQSDVSIELSGKKIRSSPPVKDFVTMLKDPQYEDISDEDLSQNATDLQYTEHAKLICFQDTRNKHTSIDETTMVENLTVGKSSLTPETGPSNNERLQLEDGSCGHEQDLIEVTAEISLNKKVPQVKRASGSPSFDEPETDDDCDVFTIIMTDLHFEVQDRDQHSPENVMHDCAEGGDQETQFDKSPVHCEEQVPQIEEFDTIDTFLQANTVKKAFELTFNPSPRKVTLDSGGEPDTSQNRRETCSEPDDSCETEDSCDYSTGSEHNYLTVSRKLLKKRPVPLPAETDSENDEEYKGEHVQNSKAKSCIEKLKLLMETKAASKNAQHETNTPSVSNTDDIIVLDSDTEDESYPNCNLNTEKKRIISADSDNEDVLYSQPKRPKLSGTVDSPIDLIEDEVLETWPCLDSAAQQQQDMDKDEDLHSEPLRLDKKRRERTDTSTGVMHMPHTTKKSAGEAGIILTGVVADYTSDLNYAKKSKKRHRSSVSKEDADAPCIQQKTSSPETEAERETRKEKPVITRLSPVVSPVQQHQSKHQLKKQSNSTLDNTTQHKTTGQKISDERCHAKKRSEDRCAAKRSTEFVDSPCPAGNKKLKKPAPSPNSPNDQSQPRDKEVHSPLGPNPANPRHSVEKSSESNKNLKTFKDYRQGSNETVAAKTSRKSTDTSEKISLHLDKNQKGQSSSIPNPGDDRSTTKMGTVHVSRPKVLLKQHSLPNPKDLPASNCSSQYLEKRQKCSDVSEKLFESCSSNTSVPRKISPFKMQRSLSSGNSSTSGSFHTSTKGPSISPIMKSSAKEHVAKAWDNSFVPTRKDRKRSLEEQKIHSTNPEKCRKDKTGACHSEQPPKQRHNVPRMQHPLMKKTKADAIRLTKAKNRDMPTMQRPVGEGYKWGEKPTMVPRAKERGAQGQSRDMNGLSGRQGYLNIPPCFATAPSSTVADIHVIPHYGSVSRVRGRCADTVR